MTHLRRRQTIAQAWCLDRGFDPRSACGMLGEAGFLTANPKRVDCAMCLEQLALSAAFALGNRGPL